MLPVNFTAMANANDSNDFLRVVDLVDDAVVAETNAPAFTLGQFFVTGRSGVFLQCPNLEFSDASCWAGKSASSLLARGKMRRL
jgi:hypothetical protein